MLMTLFEQLLFAIGQLIHVMIAPSELHFRSNNTNAQHREPRIYAKTPYAYFPASTAI